MSLWTLGNCLSVALSFLLTLASIPLAMPAGKARVRSAPVRASSSGQSKDFTRFPAFGPAALSTDPEMPIELYFAQIGNGQGLVSDLVLSNPSSSASVTGKVRFFGDDGKPMPVGLQSPKGAFSTVDFTLPPLGAKRLSTDGSGPLLAGAVRVTASRRVGGVVRFTIPGAGTTGVGESYPTREFLTPARKSLINTGLALHNPGADPIRLRAILRTASGVTLPGAITQLDLAGDAHTARFIDELFPGNNLSGFEGTLRLEVLGPGEVVASALELGSSAGQFTTLPVTSYSQSGEEPFFAQIGNGGGLTSELILTNPSVENDVTAQVQFLDDKGDPLILGLGSPGGQASSLQLTVRALGMVRVATDSLGAVKAGAARVSANGNLGGVVRFTIPGVGTTGVGESQPLSGFVTPARRTGINTGLALHNPGQQPVQVALRLRRSDGTAVSGGQSTLSIQGGGHLAQFLDELFRGASLNGFEGTLTAEISGGSVAATALELGAESGQFTTLPVTPLGGPLRVSTASAKPGQFVSVLHDSIAPGTRVMLEVQGCYPQSSVTLESASSVAGSARFMVPPVFNTTTGEMVSGQLTLRLLGSTETVRLQVSAPDTLSGVEPGSLLAWFLERTADNFRTAQSNLVTLGSQNGIDTSALRALLGERISTLEQGIAEIQGQGRLTMVRTDGQTVTLDSDALRKNDQLLMAFIQGFCGEIGSAPSGTVSPQDGFDIEAWKADFVRKLEWAAQSAKAGTAAVVGAVSLAVGLTVGTSAGLAVLAIAGLGYVLSEGIGSEGMAALTDALRDGNNQSYEFGHELLVSAEDALESLAISVGGIKSEVLEALDTILSAQSVYEAFGIKSCEDEHSGQSLPFFPAALDKSFCDDVVPLLPPVGVILVGPTYLSPDQAGSWQVIPLGGQAPYATTVSWGDGGSTQVSLPGSGGTTSHKYSNAGAFTVQATVVDQSGGQGAASMVALVEASESFVGTINVPGHISRNFNPPVVSFGLSQITDGGSTVVLDKIPTASGGSSVLPWEPGGEILGVLVHPSKVGSAPFVTSNVGWLLEGGDVHIVYTNYNIRNGTDQWPVSFEAVSGSVTISQLGNKPGDTLSGNFTVQVEGRRAVCSDDACSKHSYETITGSLTGSFSGTLSATTPARQELPMGNERDRRAAESGLLTMRN